MMRLAHTSLGFVMPCREDKVSMLVVEEPRLFRCLIQDLSLQIQGNKGGFTLSEEWVPMPIEKYVWTVRDVFSLDLNERKALTGLYKEASLLAYTQNMCEATFSMKASVSEWLSRLEMDIAYPVGYDTDIEISSLLKAANFRFDPGEGEIPELLDKLLCIYTTFLKIKVFVFVNLYGLMTQDEMDQLYRAALYRKAHVLLIESRMPDTMHPLESRYLVDKDLCELYSDQEN